MTEPILPELSDDLVEPVAWGEIEAAVYDWLIDLLQFKADCVVWENQNIPQPAYPFVSVRRSAVTKEGGIDELRTKFVADDNEVEQRWQGPRLFTLSISAYADRLCEPDDDAQAILSKVQSDLSTDETGALLYAAGMSVVKEEAVQDTSVLVNDQWISRATLDVRMRVGAMYRKRQTFIEKTEVEGVGLEPPVTFTVDSSS